MTTEHYEGEAETVVLVPHKGDRVTVTVTAPLIHVCPFRDEVDEGTIAITWTTAGYTIELHALYAWLCLFDETAISHEELTDHIVTILALRPGISDVSAVSSWDTASMLVEVRSPCSTSPTPARATP